jgi:putative ABC transport system permease protein
VLIAVATAAMILGTNVASATPGTPNASVYGTSSTLIILNGSTPHLAADIAEISKAHGPASVVADQSLPTGIAGGADLRAQNPNAPYTGPLLSLDSGRYPTQAGQVAVTSGLAQLYGAPPGPVSYASDTKRLLSPTPATPLGAVDGVALRPEGRVAGSSFTPFTGGPAFASLLTTRYAFLSVLTTKSRKSG